MLRFIKTTAVAALVFVLVMIGVGESHVAASPGGWLMFHATLEHAGTMWETMWSHTELAPCFVLLTIVPAVVAVALAEPLRKTEN